MANILTGMRILLSAALLACPAFSPVFYGVYVTAGLTDMIDGTVARKTNSVSGFGARLDTLADLALVTACLIRLLPAVDLPFWLYGWIALIACMQGLNLGVGLVFRKNLTAVHSVLNKVTGAALFLLPLTVPWLELKMTAVPVCALATAAAVQEGFLIRSGLPEKEGGNVHG